MTLLNGSGENKSWALRLINASRNCGALKAADDISLEVSSGTRHAIIGPNGAGKSTLFALISGELSLSSGSVTIMGTDVSRRGIYDSFQAFNA